jgi:hypothetical protein
MKEILFNGSLRMVHGPNLGKGGCDEENDHKKQA